MYTYVPPAPLVASLKIARFFSRVLSFFRCAHFRSAPRERCVEFTALSIVKWPVSVKFSLLATMAGSEFYPGVYTFLMLFIELTAG